MKWEDNGIPAGKPDNVFTSAWLPQDDILAHPSIRLFISHCGAGGVGEAKYHGVPILGMPFFADQPENVKAIVAEGWALELPYDQITETTLTEALNEILTNKTYAENVKQISRLYRDRPLSALDTAVYWVEYVLRHNGARHLKSEAVDLNFIQKNSLDVIACLVIAIVLLWKLLKFVFLIVWRLCCSKSKTKKVKKN